MDAGLLIICALTFVIHLIGTLAYSGTDRRHTYPANRLVPVVVQPADIGVSDLELVPGAAPREAG